jgi:excisionase family DNA binding protein
MSLIELREAAELLGITSDELNEMRGRNEIFGYRDGTSWKFKREEINRVLALREAEANSGGGSAIRLDESIGKSGSGSRLDAELDELIDIGEDSGELGDLESVLGPDFAKDVTSSSTVIGHKSKSSEDVLDSGKLETDLDADVTGTGLGSDAGGDIELVLDDEMDFGGPIELSAPSPPSSGASDLLLADSGLGLMPGSELQLDVSPVAPQRGKDVPSADSSLESSVLADPKKSTGKPAADETGAMSTSRGGDDDVLLDSDVSLDLGDDEVDISLSPSSSRINVGEASELRLAPTDTDVGLGHEIDLDSASSDVSLDAEASGINLESPSDSGISLEQTPKEILIGGDSLELGEADLDLGEGLADLDDVTMLQGDDEFLLTPVESDMFEESDSGSQVIALDSEEFEESGSTILGEEAAISVAGAEFDAEGVAGEEEPFLAGAPAMQMVPEATYSIWNVMGLGAISLILGLTGIMVFDVVRHIWSWDEPYSLSSTLMDAVTGAFGR